MMMLLVVLLVFARPASAAPDLAGVAFDPHPGPALPLDAPLRDEAGRPLRLGDALGGRPAILALGYHHCPNLCGVVRADLFAALAGSGLHPGMDYDAVVLSIDPAETAAQASRAKADDIARDPVPGADAGWHFLTGRSDAVVQALFVSHGCAGCQLGNSSVRAPRLEGVYASPVPLSDGSIVVADDKYIRDSILLPVSRVVAGFAPEMPSFAGQIGEDDLIRLIAYIKSLASAGREDTQECASRSTIRRCALPNARRRTT